MTQPKRKVTIPGRPRNRGPSRLRSRAWRIAAIYAVVAIVWIYFSDYLLGLLISDPELLLRWSVFKGIGFVALTSILLLVLMLRAFGAIEAGYASLKNHKREIEQSNRLYAALSQINQSIVMAEDQEELFHKAAAALVEHGGFQMAWAGWQTRGADALTVVTSAGQGTAFLDHVLQENDGELPPTGPWSKAINESRPYICNDMLLDEVSRPWRHTAIRNHLQSSASLPLTTRGKTCGVINVYAREPDFFRTREVALLEEAALDISFALDNFALRAERQQAEARALAESHFSQAMIESMPGILYFYNEQGKFLRWNRNFEMVSGYSADEIATMHPLQFFDEEDQRPLVERIADVFAAGEACIEAHFLSRDGTRTPYFLTGRSVTFRGERCLVGVGIDISARTAAEAALKELNETLEIKIGERTSELRDAVIRAEAADRVKSAFLATMSHELRTPLNSIIGFTAIVLQGLAGPLTDEQVKQLSMVRGSARHLLDLINDVLDLSKIEAGQLEVRSDRVRLHDSINRVMETVRPMAERKNLVLKGHLSSDLPEEILADRRRLDQILLNLLNNAIKFTDRGRVELDVSVTKGIESGAGRPSCQAVVFEVRDTGIGITPDDLAKLFQPFRQLDSGLTRQHDGTGLGLAICRRLTELMDGTISVSSEWNAGSCFTVTLPLHSLDAP